MNETYAVEFENVSKQFGKVVANNDISFGIKKGEILSLLGENGSGKTTLMNMLSGIYYPDCGRIRVNGADVLIRSPKDAFDLGIGMIHQHFKLINVFTAAENIVLGLKEHGKFDIKKAVLKIKEICDKYGFEVDPYQKVYNMTVSQKQTLEIVKVLYRGANILILDEPTAVLTPQETERLFNVMQNMKKDGKSIIIITHKLHEVLAVSDRVAILRKGEYVAVVNTNDATELSLTEMMVGKKVSLDIKRSEPVNPTARIVVKNLTCKDSDGMTVLDNISFTANSGEILGIAGIAGSGQKELLESIAGLQIAEEGSSIEYYDPGSGKLEQLIGKNPKQIKDYGIALSFVPEDRLGMGLVGSMGMAENMMVRSYAEGRNFFTERKNPRKLALKIKKDLDVITPNINTPVRKLSGGNVQKVLVGREISASPTVLMTAYAVRGLDINTSYTIYNLLNKQKQNGAAVIYVGEDLDVLLELCDRILVLCSGNLSGILDGRTATKEEVGLMMTNSQNGGEQG
ncbi:MAG: ABC transporter ATP-binding protein [Bacillota bacterium]|nr:ABC transporter ATP-binding protein [Bacillota bacterium]